MTCDGLRPADLELHARVGIAAELLAAAGVCRVTHEQARLECGITYCSARLEGIWYPSCDPERGTMRSGRVRRDHPEVDAEGKPIAKYVAPPDRHYLYFPPGAGALLADTSATVVPVESEKAALALTAAAARATRRLLAIGLGGCWGWKGTIGKTTSANGARVDEKGPLPDLDRVTWAGRDVVIVFDANAATNQKVQAARRALAAELTGRGAKIRIAELPVDVDINGPDDYIGKHGDAALFALIDGAKPASRSPKKEKAEKPKQGREVQLEDPEPWADPVNGAALVTAIAEMFTKYLVLPAHASTALALWTLHCFAFDAWFTSPFLAITSPVKRCGKTLLLMVLAALVPRRLAASNVTPAVLFRTIEKYAPTLLIDEGDTFLRDNDELRGLLNSGHTRTTAIAIRTVGEDHEPRAFSTWCPKAIFLIGKLPDTLADRSIEVVMRRRTDAEPVARLRQDRIEAECSDLRRQAARWAADHLRDLQDADSEVPAALHDRAADCWRPLLAIADLAGDSWHDEARKAAVALTGSTSDEDIKIELLHDIRTVFGVALFLKSGDLVKKLTELEDRPWADWKKGKPITTRAVAARLLAFGIMPKKNEKDERGYFRDRFEDAWTRSPL